MSFSNENRPTDNLNAPNDPPPEFEVPGQDPTTPSPPPGSWKEDDIEDKDIQQAIFDSIQSEPSQMSFEEALRKALDESLEEKKREDAWRGQVRGQQQPRLLPPAAGPSQVPAQTQGPASGQGSAQRAAAQQRLLFSAATQSAFQPPPPSHQPPQPVSQTGSEKCTICTNALKDPTTTPCGHTFCYDCLMEWLAGSSGGTCPVCGASCGMRTVTEEVVGMGR